MIESDLKYITAEDLPWESLKDRTILISGASGFLPSYMVETLLYLNQIKRYNIKILGLVHNLEKAKKKFLHHREDGNLILISQDICEKIETNENIDYIIHAASKATPKVFADNPVETITPNVVGTNNLLNLAREKKINCFLFFSTTGVYGFMDKVNYPAKEDRFGYLNPMELASCYIESKRMGENMCVAWMHQYGIPIKIVRPGITYGPGVELNDGRSFADFISNIINHQDIEIFSDGRALRSFCYLADATLGFFTVMLKGEIGEAYNIAANQEISIIDLAKLLTEKIFPERKLNVIIKKNVAKNYLRMAFSRTAMDITKTKKLGWKINFSLEEGFKKTVESFEE